MVILKPVLGALTFDIFGGYKREPPQFRKKHRVKDKKLYRPEI